MNYWRSNLKKNLDSILNVPNDSLVNFTKQFTYVTTLVERSGPYLVKME